MAASMNAEVMPRFRDAEFAEEYLRHFEVVVLASMDQDFLKSTMAQEGVTKRRGLDELRPRPDNGRDTNFLVRHP